jgi:hypothetical protein
MIGGISSKHIAILFPVETESGYAKAKNGNELSGKECAGVRKNATPVR